MYIAVGRDWIPEKAFLRYSVAVYLTDVGRLRSGGSRQGVRLGL
jgi:hypothetical protein